MARETFRTEHQLVGTGRQNRPGQALKNRASQGQVVVEFAMVLPLLLLLGLGVIDMSYLLFNHHIINRLTREGSNLIARDVTLFDAGEAMKGMVNPPVDFNGSNSKMIFTVLTNYAGNSYNSNNNKVIVYQRYEIGGLTAGSAFITRNPLSSGSFGPQPDYYALNPQSNVSLQVTNVPANLILNRGQYVYVTEIFTRHTTITPLERFGIALPTTLYSVAYF